MNRSDDNSIKELRGIVSLNDLQALDKKLIIVTGISCSGKTELSKRINKELSYPVLSLDDYKVNLYEKYGFKNNNERKLVWQTAKGVFELDIISKLRSSISLVVEYPFDTSWQSFFNSVAKEYDYKLVCIYCNSRDFNDIWQSRLERDSDESRRQKCLTASAYIKDKLYISNNKLNDNYKTEKQKQYFESKYTSIRGDYILNDIEVNAMLAK